MNEFNKREQSFEKKFAKDEELKFKERNGSVQSLEKMMMKNKIMFKNL